MTRAAKAIILVMLLCFAGLCAPVPVLAQAQNSEPATRIDPRKLLVQPRVMSGKQQAYSPWREPVLWVMDQQRSFYAAMSLSLRQIKTQAPFAAVSMLLLLSFGYGVFHAAGPGHGKAVISAWLLATENELRRGILIAFMSAAIQALTAVAIVTALLLLVTAVGTTARNVAGFLESASYGLIAVMGAYLAWSAFRPRPDNRGAHDHSHAEDTEHAHHNSHDHDHDHHACGHAHVPEAREVKGEWSLSKALSLSLAVGLRPCSGALLSTLR